MVFGLCSNLAGRISTEVVEKGLATKFAYLHQGDFNLHPDPSSGTVRENLQTHWRNLIG